jgi:5-methylcytosine-specific restriction endonuclease McrA
MAKRTLVLTPWYFPHKVVSWQTAVTMMYLGKVDVLVSYSEELRSPSTTIKTPAVLRLKKKVITIKRGVRFSRLNVYTRDNFTCMYCAKHLPASELTFDHVVPRSRGGATRWDNIVSACHPCNRKKGNRTPEQAGMDPLRQPYRPQTLPMLPPRIDLETAPAEWRVFCEALPQPG